MAGLATFHADDKRKKQKKTRLRSAEHTNQAPQEQKLIESICNDSFSVQVDG
jgi:hypothetical protein